MLAFLPMAKVLIIGGAGYVGSSVSAALLDKGHSVWAVDDLSTGFRELVLGEGFTLARAGDEISIQELLASHRFDCAMHFAASSLVEESVRNPQKYLENNVRETARLLDALAAGGLDRLVFSSSCAVFGDPGFRDMDESTPMIPINPYGQSKRECEQLLAEYSRKKGLKAIALRYFNAAGCEEKLRVGEMHDPETHLIPNVLEAAWSGKPVKIFGKDYPSRDGTCVRDYIHVSDLADAHEAAMNLLIHQMDGVHGTFEAYNLGSDTGFTVLEVVQAAESVTGRKISIDWQPRRPGDPPRLVAQSAHARKTLGFQPKKSKLETILRSAWDWKQKLAARSDRAVFLDRDGTLNVDPGYLSQPEQMALLPGVGEALRELKEAGFKLHVVSNQSGVGRGLIAERDLPRIHQRLSDLLAPFGVTLDGFQLCLHRPEDKCECRKPQARLLIDAARKHHLDLPRSYMIGDKQSDVLAGLNAGLKGSLLVRTGDGKKEESAARDSGASFIAEALPQAVRWILDQET